MKTRALLWTVALAAVGTAQGQEDLMGRGTGDGGRVNQSSPLPSIAAFWESFGDPTLQRLLTEGLRSNQDVQVAHARVNAARAARLDAALELAPAITVTGGYTRQRLAAAAFPGASGTLPSQEIWDAGLQLVWELDLFGRLRRSAIHGDANDYNVLVDPERMQIVGLLDFGDMVYSYTVGNVAIAIAYVVLDKADPRVAANTVVEGYRSEFPLLDNELEAVSASLKVPFYKTFWRVTVPVCMPAIIDIGRYYFVNAMTTISAVVFLYSPQTTLAAISILHLDEAGNVGGASAMATLIVATSALVTALLFCLEWVLVRRTQAWRFAARN